MIFDRPVYKFETTIEYSEEDIYTIWLASVDGMKAVWGRMLIQEYGSAKAVWDNCARFSETGETGGSSRNAGSGRDNGSGEDVEISENAKSTRASTVPTTLRYQLKARRDRAYLDKLLEELTAKRIFCVPYGHSYYPELLTEIDDAPIILYVRGNVNLNQERMIAIVGTRECTKAGGDVSQKLAQSLSMTGVTVVSGLALGIDSRANEGALSGPTPTFAVLGCGVDIIYPQRNTDLYNRIIQKGGSIISEYPPGTPVAKWRFPERNRIMSGMCQGVTVIEAPEKSGTIHTVNSAIAQNREVFAVPGGVTVAQSELPNKLIKDGCRPVLSAWDIIEELGWGSRPEPKKQTPQSPKTAPSKSPRSAPDITPGNAPKSSPAAPSPDEISLSEAENRALRCENVIKNIDEILAGHDNRDDKKLILLCINSQELGQNDIAQATGLPVGKINSYLTMLELETIIEQALTGYYRLRV